MTVKPGSNGFFVSCDPGDKAISGKSFINTNLITFVSDGPAGDKWLYSLSTTLNSDSEASLDIICADFSPAH